MGTAWSTIILQWPLYNYFLQLGQALQASVVLSFLDVYGYSMEHHYFAVAIVQLFPAAWIGGTSQYSVSLILDVYGYNMEQHYFSVAIVQLFPAAWVDGTSLSF
jgi:hypothetical protein